MKKETCFKRGAVALAAVLTGSLFVSAVRALHKSEVQVSATELSQTFHEDDIRLTFASMSDSHIGYQQQQTDTLRRALSYVKGHYSVDALYFHGDQTQDGKEEQAKQFLSLVKEFYEPTETAFIITNGNHDTYWSGCMSTEGFYNAYGPEVYTFDKDLEAAKSGNRHVVVNGYHFISVNIASYLGANGFDRITEATRSWLKTTLAEIVKEEGGDVPIFISSHSPQTDTVWGSESDSVVGKWGSTDVYDDLLGNYPQAILFSGHTHMAINDERAINQTAYTQIHAGSTSDAVININQMASDIPDNRSYSDGMIVEVDGEGNVRVTRLDFKMASVIKQPWIIPAPKADKSHLTVYSAETRAAANTAPAFEGTIEALFKTQTELKVSFPKAVDDDMVFRYTVKIKKDGNEQNSATFYSPFFDYPDLTKLPETVSYTFTSFNVQRPFTVEIYATDGYGLISEAFTTEVVDTTEQDRQAAEAFDRAVNDLGSAENLTADDLAAVRAVRTAYQNSGYYVRRYITKYDDFVAIESYFYSRFYLADDAGKYAPNEQDCYSLASTATRGSFSDSEYAGVKMLWNGATKNQLLGFNDGYDLDGLHLCMTNLSFSSENRKLGILLSNTAKSKYAEGRNLVVYVDFSNGNVYVNNGVVVGKSRLLVEDSLSVLPFEIKFAVTDEGVLNMNVHTMEGDETVEIPSSYVSSCLDTHLKTYVSFSPWDTGTTASLEITAIHDGACATSGNEPVDPVDPETPTQPNDPEESAKKGLSPGAVAGIVIAAVAAAGVVTALIVVLRKKRNK